MKRYETYKPSGFEWLGEIPTHWEVERIKDFTYLKARIGWQGLRSDEFVDDSNWYCLTGTDFSDGRINWENCYCIDKDRYNQDKKIQLKIDDLLITKDGTIGKIALVNFLPKPTTLNSGVFVSRPRLRKYTNTFMYWILSSNVFTSFIDLNKNGTTILHLYQNVFERFYYSVPSLPEQTTIATYLDAKTSAIDRKIELLTAKADKYKALRCSLINETVCRGLNPKVLQKYSGIEWIGMIPEHWDVKRVKEIFRITGSGTTPPSGDQTYYDDNGFYWLQTGDLNDGFITDTSKKISKKAIDEFSTLKRYPINSLVIAMYGATIGKMGYLNINTTTNQACCVLTRPIGNNSQYLFYQFLSMKQFIISLSTGGGQPNINQDIVRFLTLCIPPLSEQIAISKYLDEKTTQIDTILTNISEQINKLSQLRKTLINDVVTGKIKLTED